MRKAVHCTLKMDKLKNEMADMDKLACAVKESRDEIDERLNECESRFVKVCNENHELRDQLLQQPKSHSCNCADRGADKIKLQLKLDQMAKELNDKKDNGSALKLKLVGPRLI